MVTVVSVGGWVVSVVVAVVSGVVVVGVVVSGVVVVVVSGSGAGTDVEGGGDLAGSGKRSSRVTGGHIGAACAAVFASPATTRAAEKMSAPTRAGQYLPDMMGQATDHRGGWEPGRHGLRW